MYMQLISSNKHKIDYIILVNTMQVFVVVT